LKQGRERSVLIAGRLLKREVSHQVPSTPKRRVWHLEHGGRAALHTSISPVVSARCGGRGVACHLLHGGQVDTEVEQIPDPGPAQVMRGGGLDLSLEPALTTDPPGAAGAEASQLIALPQQAPGLEHRTEEGARL
jgi:hypothetical protein